MKPEMIFTVDATAIHLRRSSSWVYRAIKAGRIAAARVGNGWRIPSSEIARLLRPANAAAVENFRRTQLYRQIDRQERELVRDIKQRGMSAGAQPPI